MMQLATDRDEGPAIPEVPPALFGHRLIARRGRGRGAEVWEAEAPGGFRVALKLVYLSTDLRAGELRSLEILRTIHHPNLLAVFGAWQDDSALVIGMELADRSLWDRYWEATAQGLRGIPRGELLGYLAAAADAVDYLNDYRHSFDGRPGLGIQHRDLKPQNILLIGGCAKVADFGMARVMERSVASHTGRCTLAYAAPEFFVGRTSRRSDQYALAVTYCQLRGGRLPFQGSTAEITIGHLLNEPDLSGLPEPERAAVARALSKRPEDRWPDCRSFVEALRAVVSAVGDAVPDTLPLEARRMASCRVDEAEASPACDLLVVPEGDSDFIPVDSYQDSDWPVDLYESVRTLALSRSAPAAAVADLPAPLPEPAREVGEIVAPPSPEATPMLRDGPIARGPGDVDGRSTGRPTRLLRLALVAALVVIGLVILPRGASRVPVARPAPRTVAIEPAARPDAPPPSAVIPLEAPVLPDVNAAASAAVVAVESVSGPVRAAVGPASLEWLIPASRRWTASLKRAWTAALHEAPGRSQVLATIQPGRRVPDRPTPPTTPVAPVASPTAPDVPAPVAVRQVAKPAANVPPPAAEAAFAKGRGEYRRWAYDQAIASFTEALRLDPELFAARLHRAMALHHTDHHAQALAECEEAIRLQPREAETYLVRARVYRDREKPALALADLNKAVELRPDMARAYVARGRLHHDMGSYPQALADFDAALKLRSDDAATFFYRGLTRYHSEDYARAIADFSEAIRLDAKHADAYHFRSEANARLGNNLQAWLDHNAKNRLAEGRTPAGGDGSRPEPRSGRPAATRSR